MDTRAGACNSIGIMLVSGMIFGTVFALSVVPSIYMLVAKKHEREQANVMQELQELPAEVA